ncbi:MAG: hypothetical protein HQL41_07040 [Alphaproteobacteria bacterium]|nr:hypothetical protein [Alphaproteobacteria bacterium]
MRKASSKTVARLDAASPTLEGLDRKSFTAREWRQVIDWVDARRQKLEIESTLEFLATLATKAVVAGWALRIRRVQITAEEATRIKLAVRRFAKDLSAAMELAPPAEVTDASPVLEDTEAPPVAEEAPPVASDESNDVANPQSSPPLKINFGAPPGSGLTNRLRQAGFDFDKPNRTWYGTELSLELRKAVEDAGGKVGAAG